MQALQWSMTIPKDKQHEFVEFFETTLKNGLQIYGAIDHKLYKVADREIIGRQLVEANRFIELLYFEDDFDIPSYFAKVKVDPVAWELSRTFENKFSATDIELRVLQNIAKS